MNEETIRMAVTVEVGLYLLREAMEEKGMDYVVNEGDGVPERIDALREELVVIPRVAPVLAALAQSVAHLGRMSVQESDAPLGDERLQHLVGLER